MPVIQSGGRQVEVTDNELEVLERLHSGWLRLGKPRGMTWARIDDRRVWERVNERFEAVGWNGYPSDRVIAGRSSTAVDVGLPYTRRRQPGRTYISLTEAMAILSPGKLREAIRTRKLRQYRPRNAQSVWLMRSRVEALALPPAEKAKRTRKARAQAKKWRAMIEAIAPMPPAVDTVM